MLARFVLLETDSKDVSLYASLERALLECEPSDVADGVYRLFEVGGREWELQVHRSKPENFFSTGAGTVAAVPTAIHDPAVVHQAVRDYLAVLGVAAPEHDLDAMLLALAAAEGVKS